MLHMRVRLALLTETHSEMCTRFVRWAEGVLDPGIHQ